MPRSYHPTEDRHVARLTNSARSMIVIHTRLRSTANRHDPSDMFPSIMDLVEAKQHRQKSSVKSNSMTRSNTTRNGTTKPWQHRKRLQTGSTKVWPKGINLSERSIQSFNINASEHDDRWSTRRESIDELREILTNTKKRKKQNCCGSKCPCSLLCILASIVIPLLLGTVLAALLVAFLPKTTTTSLTSVGISNTTITTSTTVTTTTQVVCGTISCVKQSWLSDNSRLARWHFDNDLLDNVTNVAASSAVSPNFTTGYINNAMPFSIQTNQSVTTPSLNLTDASFTIDAWIFPTALSNPLDHSIFGLCPLLSNLECLYLTIRLGSSGHVLHFGLLGDDCPGNTMVVVNEWIHVAFVFELSSYTQSIYINGKLDVTRTSSGPLKVNPGSATIGNIPMIDSSSGYNHFQGLIDRLTVTARDKSSCEILEEATLATYFTFDTSVQYKDLGPNTLSVTTQALSSVPSGHKQQALSFSRSASSYLQVSGVSSLGISNRPFSISLWIRPRSLSGVILHVSSNAVGTGWCLPFLGFASNGSVVAQIFNGVVKSVMGPSISIGSTWTHIVQTWGPTSGIRLYLNNVLVASTLSMASSYTASSLSTFVTLGNLLSGTSCAPGLIGSMIGFDGDIDEFRIYSRELSTDDICTLYTN